MENSKIYIYFFFTLGLDIRRKLASFLKELEIPYLSIFFSSLSDNINSVKKNKEIYEKIENNFFFDARLKNRLEVGAFS